MPVYQPPPVFIVSSLLALHPTQHQCNWQAKIQDLHQQIEELTQKVGSLQTENAALHSRTSILEKVLDMRNEQIQVMQESKEVRRVVASCCCAAEGALAGFGGQACCIRAMPDVVVVRASYSCVDLLCCHMKRQDM
jgi:hypothetical protein